MRLFKHYKKNILVILVHIVFEKIEFFLSTQTYPTISGGIEGRSRCISTWNQPRIIDNDFRTTNVSN